MRHRPLNGIVDERANGSETGTRIENKETDRAREREHKPDRVYEQQDEQRWVRERRPQRRKYEIRPSVLWLVGKRF
jgi:hypothetical protein